MKRITMMILMITGLTTKSQVPNNAPELIDPIVQQWTSDAIKHGFDHDPHLTTLKSITMVDHIHGIAGAHYLNGRITISRQKLWRDSDGTIFPDDLKWKIYHEIGHHFGLADCYQCRYHIMSGNMNERALHLYKDIIIQGWIDDHYFITIKDPRIFNQQHIHR